LLPGNAEEQVGVFLDGMRAGLGSWRGHLVQLDCEAADAQTIREWLRVWRVTTGGYPVLGYLPDWREGQWAGSDLATYDFAGWWASEYVPGEGSMLDLFAKVTADTWHRWDEVEPTILQFTGKASVPGVPGPLRCECVPRETGGTSSPCDRQLARAFAERRVTRCRM
jgi:hypothetical protein